MIKFDSDKVKLIHQLIAQETGGSPELRDEGLLEASIDGVFQTFEGEELYPSKEEKGARLGYNLISNHPFVDGNKRIGMHIMIVFLEVNGIKIDAPNEEVASMGLNVASGNAGYEELLDWVRKYSDWLPGKKWYTFAIFKD